ncbi:MAG: hypothetical protein GF308_04310 [Candidatus Heimdallarchaeota archaeon]|nr:hypothetical protein [Candidatus Heimdallarchaeota archaeon]
MSSELAKKTAVNLFFGVFIQAVIALFFDAGGIISGTIASFLMDTKRVKWIVLVYGPLLAARGDISVLVGKLGTGLHLGTVRPTLNPRKNTSAYKSMFAAVMTIALFDAVLVGIITYVMNLISFAQGVKILNPTLFMVIPVLVLALTAILSTQITAAVSFFTYKRGLNPDVYVCPVMSTVNNILITLIFAGVLNILTPWGELTTVEGVGEVYAVPTTQELVPTYIGIIPAVLSLGAVIYLVIKNLGEEEFRKIMKEAIPAVFASASIGTITGFTLSKAEPALEQYPQLLVAFPALIGTLVDQCSITANILITDFSAGYIEPSVKSFKETKVWTTYLGMAAGGIVITIVLGFIGTLIKISSVGFTWVILLVMVVTILANAIGYVLVGALIFVLTIIAFRKEMDPDNFAIPIAACLADLVCAGLILVFSILLLGVHLGGGHEETAQLLGNSFFENLVL